MRKTLVLSSCAIAAFTGTLAGAQMIDWALPVDGNWNVAGNWSGANIPNAATEDAVLGLVGAYAVTQTNSFTIGSLTLSNPLASLEIGNNQTLFLNGDLSNDGSVAINFPPTVFNTRLSFVGDATISGSGSIFLNAQSEPGDAQILANTFTLTQSLGHTIHGSGLIAGSIMNSGDIIADIPGGVGLRLAGTTTQTATGKSGADGGTLLLGNGSVTAGGELISLNGGAISVENTATIGSIINSGSIGIPGQGWFLLTNGDVQNDGTININSNNAVFNAHLRFDVPSAINGSGNILMVSVGDLGDAQILTGGAFSGTIGADQLVEGSGLVTGSSGGTISNLGTINGNDPVIGLGLAGNHDGGGMYRSDNGRLILRSGLIFSGGSFDSTGTGIVETDHGGLSTLSDVTNLGQMGIVGQGGTIGLGGTMTNDGTITVNSNNATFNAHLRFDASTSIGGNGTVHMVSRGDLGDAQLFTNGVFDGTIGADQTVDGSGIVDGRSGGTVINNGTINGNHAAVDPDPALALELRGNHNGNMIGVYRSDDGILALGNGLVLEQGIFDSSGVGIVDATSGGLSTLSDVTNLGQMGIRGQGGTVALAGAMTNDGTITVNSNSATFNAHLRMDNAMAAINGTGTVRMKTLGDLGDAQLFTSGEFSGTIGAGQTVAGSGIVDGRSLGTIVNNGTINGDDPSFELRLQGNHDGSGSGVYRSDDGVLGLSSGLVLNGGSFDSSGTGIVDMTTNGTATLSGVTNIGMMGIRGQGGVVGLAGTFTNNGTVLINSNHNTFNAHIRFLAETEIDGTGTIDLFVNGDFGDAQILNDQGFVGTIGPGQTITGSGKIVGEMNMNGTLDPSSTQRQLDIDNLHLSPSSGIVADLGGLLGGEFDRLTLGGADSIDLDGTLTVNVDNGYVPTFGDSWDIVSGGTIIGMFETINAPTAPLGQIYRVIYESDRVYVVLTCDADLTGDNTLDFFDVSAFLNFFSSQDVRGDLTGDGQFNFFDVSLFLQIFSGGCAG